MCLHHDNQPDDSHQHFQFQGSQAELEFKVGILFLNATPWTCESFLPHARARTQSERCRGVGRFASFNVTPSISHLTATPHVRPPPVVLLKAGMIQARRHAPWPRLTALLLADTRNGSRRAGVGEHDHTSHLTARLQRQRFRAAVHYLFCETFQWRRWQSEVERWKGSQPFIKKKKKTHRGWWLRLFSCCPSVMTGWESIILNSWIT